MSRVIVWSLVTLDGSFEGAKHWDIDWHESVWGEELEQLSMEQLRAAGTLLFGRVTYEGMAAYWPSAKGDIADFMNSVPKLVFSRTLETADWAHTRLVKGPPEEEVARLKRQPGKDILICGSAILASILAQHGLIDEYRFGLTPIVLGAGTPFFKPGPTRLRMKLLEARPLKNGCVILRYEPDESPASTR